MSNWKQTLAAVAPTLAAAIGGPLAGAAVNVIGQALLGREGAYDEDMISQAVLGATPDQLLALKSADGDFRVQMKKLDIQDRDSARKLAIDTGILPQITLSSIYTVGYFWLMFMLMSGDVKIPVDIQGLVTTLIGIMTAAQAQIMNFWFGSSSGSKEKTKRMGG
jgi:hypothetical protein